MNTVDGVFDWTIPTFELLAMVVRQMMLTMTEGYNERKSRRKQTTVE
jgi:hypothetical protein